MDTHKEIQSIRSILHLIYHRNKNQHQKAKWWRWLSMLKRTVSSLASSSSIRSGSGSNSSSGSGSGSKDLATNPHLYHLNTYLIPKCYLAFSTVVADNQFSTLGIVLLAALARLAKVTGMKYPKPPRVDASVQSKAKAKAQRSVASKPAEDRGERISRGDGDGDGEVTAGPSASASASAADTDMPISRKKKQSRAKEENPVKEKTKRVKSSSKKKKNDAIDDLFSGLF